MVGKKRARSTSRSPAGTTVSESKEPTMEYASGSESGGEGYSSEEISGTAATEAEVKREPQRMFHIGVHYMHLIASALKAGTRTKGVGSAKLHRLIEELYPGVKLDKSFFIKALHKGLELGLWTKEGRRYKLTKMCRSLLNKPHVIIGLHTHVTGEKLSKPKKSTGAGTTTKKKKSTSKSPSRAKSPAKAGAAVSKGKGKVKGAAASKSAQSKGGKKSAAVRRGRPRAGSVTA